LQQSYSGILDGLCRGPAGVLLRRVGSPCGIASAPAPLLGSQHPSPSPRRLASFLAKRGAAARLGVLWLAPRRTRASRRGSSTRHPCLGEDGRPSLARPSGPSPPGRPRLQTSRPGGRVLASGGAAACCLQVRADGCFGDLRVSRWVPACVGTTVRGPRRILHLTVLAPRSSRHGGEACCRDVARSTRRHGGSYTACRVFRQGESVC